MNAIETLLQALALRADPATVRIEISGDMFSCELTTAGGVEITGEAKELAIAMNSLDKECASFIADGELDS